MVFFSRIFLFIFLVLLMVGAAPEDRSFDVIIVGSEPEGVAAAVAAAESGAKTLLLTEDSKIGGLFTLGQMNSLDLHLKPVNYQQGLFSRWWTMVGKGHSFDVRRAEAAFNILLQNAGVTVKTSVEPIEPVMTNGVVTGLHVGEKNIDAYYYAKQIIDATSEMDFATLAGANYSFGFSSIGFNARMADTLVFQIDGVDWQALSQGIRQRGKDYASVDEHVAWGHFGGYPAAYKAQDESIRLRGLNLGLQEDGSILVNALLIYGVNPFDEASKADARVRATQEAARIIDYLKLELPGFAQASLGGVAERLYIRETRHLEGVCKLTVDDVLDNRVTPLDVAAGGYPLDVQTLTPYDSGYVYGKGIIYGAQLCVNVPDNLTNLWVVGKAASYDPIAASSARVVPFGMVLAEAVGVAASMAAQGNQSSQEFIAETSNILNLRTILQSRGAYLPEVEARSPVGPFGDLHYDAYRLMLSRGLAVGGYSNNPDLGKEMSAISYVYLLSNVGQRFFNDPDFGKTLVASYPDSSIGLSAELALQITHDAACLMNHCVGESWPDLLQAGIISKDFSAEEVLTRGQMYALAADLTTFSLEKLASN